MTRHYSAMPLAGYADCLLWLMQAMNYQNHPETAKAPDPKRLLTGLPQGVIEHAKAHHGTAGDPAIAFTVHGRTPRIVDPEAFVAIRLLLLSGGTMLFNVAEGRHYLYLFAGDRKVPAFRIIADAQPSEVVKEAKDHHDLRRRGLGKTNADAVEADGKMVKATHRGRESSIETAVENHARNSAKTGLPISRSDYEWLLREAFVLLDAVPLGLPPTEPTAAGKGQAET